MLFGVKLASSIYPPWKNAYIDYDGLKGLLKEGEGDEPSKNSWTSKDESRFVEALDKELEKVYTFQIQRYNGLMDKLTLLEKRANSEEKIKTLDPENFKRVLEDALSETQELDSFSRLNFTGFVKIVKKHDKLHPKFPSVKSLLEVRLKELPFHSEEYSPLLYRISYLYEILRGNFTTVSQSLASTSRLSSVVDSQTVESQEYKIFKFWIHQDNVMEVKTRILRHLPVLVYASAPTESDDLINNLESTTSDIDVGGQSSVSGPSQDEETNNRLSHSSFDPIVTTIYFDNEHFELYTNKLLKSTSAPTLRLRWTGKLVEKPDIFLEKKELVEGSTSNEPAHFEETRLKLKQKYLNGFIFEQDKKFKDNLLKKLKERGTSEEELSKIGSDYDSLQDFIRQEQLQPMIRTMYTRTAFQIPGDDRIRITIDSDILFIREDSLDEVRPVRDPKNWHRNDIDANITNPLRFLRTGEYAKFPFSVMEIKVKASNTEGGISNNKMSAAKLPKKHGRWISELTNSHLVKEVPKFSVFIQGIASLYGEDDRLDILPFWLPELESDIRTDPKQAYETEKKKAKEKKEIIDKIKGVQRLSRIQGDKGASDISVAEGVGEDSSKPTAKKMSDVSDLDDHESSDEETNSRRKSRKKGKKKTKGQATEAIFLRILTGRESKLTGVDSEEEEVELPAGVKKPTSYIKNAGPIRVEAKVWLANERTFNRWLHVTTLLSVLTFSIYNSVQKAAFPRLANILAHVYFALTLFCGIWAYKTYVDRLRVIRERSGEHLDAPMGPIVVAVVLALTLTINFVVAFREAAIRQREVFSVASTGFRQGDNVPTALRGIQSLIFKLVGAN